MLYPQESGYAKSGLPIKEKVIVLSKKSSILGRINS
jgi:hypothetical protein